MNLLKPFKKLPKGYYRLLIAGWIIIPLLVTIILTANASRTTKDIFPVVILIFVVFVYYILARFGVWIYEGFKEQDEK